MPSEGGTFAKHKIAFCGGDDVKSQRMELMLSQTAVCLMNVEVGGCKSCPTILIGFFFQPSMANPNPNPLHPHAELHERQWRTNLLHEHGSLSLANTSNIQHLARATVPFQKKSSSSCEAAQCRFDFVVTSLFCSCCFWGDKVQIEYLCLLLLSCEQFATHRMILRSV